MLKHLPICAALIVFGTGCAGAQQREAELKRIEVPGAAYDLLLATPKVPEVIFDLSKSPDAFVINLVGGALALGRESGEDLLNASDMLRSPIGAFQVRREDGTSPTPVAVYMIPKSGALASGAR